ncbi:MAG: sulfotransferase family 2 domain-containing protein [Psychroflexus sp.]|nr:sulfotransferase family 2 domain-containing protein [Psychroflexus sp.]MDR9448807.1 sulfotransferase family 2 domain-containing protein [Psychroflexus sp.]
MYSTLKRQKSYKKIKRWMVTVLPFDRYALVRDPYDRLESFYFDKLHKSLDDTDYFVRSQRIFFSVMNLEGSTAKEKHEALKEIDFPKFIELLPEIYDRNRHLHPQYWMFKNTKYKRFLKIEHHQDQDMMRKKLNIDLNIKANVTDKQNIDWQKNMIEVVNKIYNEDFRLFDYQKNEI